MFTNKSRIYDQVIYFIFNNFTAKIQTLFCFLFSDEKYAVMDYCARNLLQISELNREDSPIPGEEIVKCRLRLQRRFRDFCDLLQISELNREASPIPGEEIVKCRLRLQEK